MSINDIREELSSLKTVEKTNNDKTINDILDNNIKLMEDFVNTKVINIYARPWNKLEIKLKKKKISEYFSLLLENKEINESEHISIVEKLHRLIDLNKKIKLDYDVDQCCITSFDYNSYIINSMTA